MPDQPQRFEEIAQINAARWDRAAGGGPFSSHAWLSYGERVHRTDRPIYQLAEPAGGEAACVCWVRRREQLPVSPGLVRTALERLLLRQPLVTCQTAVASLSGLFTGRQRSTDERTVAALRSGMLDVLQEAGGSFLILPYLDPVTAASPGWGDGFLTASMPPNTYLPIRWVSFKAYLHGLSASARKDYRRRRNQADRLKLQTAIHPSPPDPARVVSLIRSVEQKHQAAPLPYLDELIAARPLPGGRWIVVEREGETVGCGLILRDRRWIVLTALGLAEGSKNVYFELIYGAIAHAIESGAAGVFGGGGAYPFKKSLGFEATAGNRVLFYARDPRLRGLGAWLAARETRGLGSFLLLDSLRPSALRG